MGRGTDGSQDSRARRPLFADLLTLDISEPKTVTPALQ